MPDPAALSRVARLQAISPERHRESEPLFDDGLPRHYGGRSLAQAVRAAGLTVDEAMVVHSVHASFLAGGEVGVPVELAVASLRDGRSFATRGVDSWQGASRVLQAMVSFHRPERGDEWDPHPDRPLPPLPAGRASGVVSPLAGFEIRAEHGVSERGWPRHPYWFRTVDRVDDDPRVHECLLAYVSDAGLVWASRRLGTAGLVDRQLASLDHAMWFHRRPRVDEWMVCEAEPVVNTGARGLTSARIRDADGRLVASVMQETLFRPGPGGPRVAGA
ncbi:acyl-CoA thioesterase domain-containing protein [Aeromicrobium sp.]|uniref:acyl-CoA thioesterase n=1 Tax=Aeromicrobium sp. TaxID=1871063 RepID=UPI0025C6162B|nr:acyl-CoA thioesterase domain-containing protein [Aeromicrobium sp.]MCK5892607.1 thioesterase family protein [Aeromicrobium sp.]